MKLFFSLFSVLLMLYAQNSFSESQAAVRLAELLSGLNMYQANFQQRVTEPDGYVLDENTGVMSFERPGKLYWCVQEPFPSVLIADGESVYFYDPDLDQVTIRQWTTDPSVNPLAVFMGGISLADYYQVEQTDQAFTLIPHTDHSGFSEMQIEFVDDQPVGMRVLDGLGQVTDIQFSAMEDAEDGKLFPEDPYSFDIPATAEVINDG